MDNGVDMKLIPGQICEWYRDGLYLIPEPGEAKPKKESWPVRKYLVLSSEPVEGTTLELLTGIMQACRIQMGEVNVLTFRGDMDYLTLLEKTGAGFVLLFGVEPGQIDLPLVFPHFQTQSFGSVTWVAAPDLSLLQHDKLMKSKLWLCLKEAFSI